jgi:hypothetical protein
MNENEQGIEDRMKKHLGQRYIRVQVELGKEIALDNAADATLEFLYEKAEEKYHDIEEITRFLLINHDAWRDAGGRGH